MDLLAPTASPAGAAAGRAQALQIWRRRAQIGFFALFLLAPSLNLLRFDLYETQLWVLGMRWSLGIDGLLTGEISATQAALNLLWRALLPAVLLVGGFLALAYRYGRIYCGWSRSTACCTAPAASSACGTARRCTALASRRSGAGGRCSR